MKYHFVSGVYVGLLEGIVVGVDVGYKVGSGVGLDVRVTYGGSGESVGIDVGDVVTGDKEGLVDG